MESEDCQALAVDQQALLKPDLLFAWLSPIEKKVDNRIHPNRPKSPSSPSAVHTPFVNKAKSAFRKTFKSSTNGSVVLRARSQSHKLRVREANDACLWLRAAGFPQYVQMYEDGQFPINLSKIQVEKDHEFLEQPDIDSLVRRLNILNRCADLMEEIKSQKDDDSEDESRFRALSDQWHFRKRNKTWSRRSRPLAVHSPDNISSSLEDSLAEDGNEIDTPTDLSPLLLVTELRGSLTGLDRRVKTYSFLPSDDQLPKIIVNSFKSTECSLEEETTSSANETVNGVLAGTGDMACGREKHTQHPQDLIWPDNSEEDQLCSFASDDMDTFAGGDMDTFATDMFTTFESNLLKYRTQSLPDIYSNPLILYDGSEDEDDVPLMERSTTSSASTSGVSILNSSKDSVLEDPYASDKHPLHTSNGHPRARSADINGHHPHAESADINGHPVRGVTGEPRNGAELELVHDESPPSHLSLRQDGSISSENYESAESEISKSRPETPISPQRRLTSSFDESRYGNSRIRKQSDDRMSMSSVSTSGGRHSFSSRHEDVQRPEFPKWHSFQMGHSYRQVFKPVRTLIPIEELSVGQISVLKKLGLIKLTALIELSKSKSNIMRILNRRKLKIPDVRHKRLFGVPLLTNVKQGGQALPSPILAGFEYLRGNDGLQTNGLFRRGASKSKIEGLKLITEANPTHTNFDDFSCYEVADFIKLYFRELPECLFTNKLSETLLMIQENIPSQLRLQALQAAMLLMPDENREALQTLLLFLKEVSEHSKENQMDAKNLAVCLAPSLFSLSSSLPKPSTNMVRVSSFRRNVVSLTNQPKMDSPATLATNRMVNESVVFSQCLAELISQAHKIFSVAADMLQVCKFTCFESADPVPYYELGSDKSRIGNYDLYIESCVQCVQKEIRKKFKGWIHHSNKKGGVDISYLKPTDGIPLRVWRGVVDVEASADSVLKKLWIEKHVWDGNCSKFRQVTKVDDQTEILQYVSSSPPVFTDRDHCIIRSWNFDPVSETYIIISTSVSHPSASLQAGIRATELATRYIIEKVDKEKTRLTYICRVDIRGRSSDYYNSAYGPYLAASISDVRDSFQGENFHETRV